MNQRKARMLNQKNSENKSKADVGKRKNYLFLINPYETEKSKRIVCVSESSTTSADVINKLVNDATGFVLSDNSEHKDSKSHYIIVDLFNGEKGYCYADIKENGGSNIPKEVVHQKGMCCLWFDVYGLPRKNPSIFSVNAHNGASKYQFTLTGKSAVTIIGTTLSSNEILTKLNSIIEFWGANQIENCTWAEALLTTIALDDDGKPFNRILTYEYAKRNNIRIPNGWILN
jgi:hypothetical protein